MKLIYIATSVIPSPKANSYQVMKMCEALALKGVDVELLIPVRFGNVRAEGDPFDYYGLKTRFKIKKIFSFDLIPLEKYLGHLGFWIQNLSFTIFLSFYLVFRRVDIIYTRDKFTLFLLRLFRKNLVWEAHNFPKRYSWFYKFILRRLKKIIVITNGLKAEFIKVGYPEDNILVAPDAADLNEFKVKESQTECRQILDLPLEKKIILYTGHLFYWKGVYTLAEASKYLNDRCEIVVVGGMDKDLENYRDYLKENNLAKVKALGFRNHNEMPRFLKAADILVLPNSAREKISTTYTSPMKLFEYMASERPIVASDLPSIREILSDNEAVFAIADDARSLAKRVERVLGDEALGFKIAQNGRKKVEQYTWGRRVENILNFIK